MWWLRQGRLVAAFTMNRPEEEREAAPRLIQSKQAVSDRLCRERTESSVAHTESRDDPRFA